MDNPTAKATVLSSRTRNGVSEAIAADASSQPSVAQPAETKDIYTQPMDLDELRQKGIITAEEFEGQKKKILAAN